MVSKVSWAPFHPDSEKFLTFTIYLQIFCEFKTHFFFGEKGRSFRQETTVRAWPAMGTLIDGVACLVVMRWLTACLNLRASFFFFLNNAQQKSSISKTLMQQRRRGHACAVLPVRCAGHIIVKSVRQVPTLTCWSVQPRHVCRPTT